MHERERWRAILVALQTRQVVPVSDLQEQLDSSAATVRRDLARLERLGKLRRVHGGAEAVDGGQPQLLVGQQPLDHSRTLQLPEKRAIARRAASMCQDDEPIIIDGGSTTFLLTEFLCDRSLQVLTNSFPIANALYVSGRVRVMVPAGEIYRDQGVMLSPFDDPLVQNYHATQMFMGAQAIRAQGLMQTDPLLVQAEHRLIERAQKLVVLLDSSKFRQTAGMILCPLKKIDVVVTDTGASSDSIAMLEDAGIRVELVDPDPY